MNIATAVTADGIYYRYLTVMLYSLFVNNTDEEIDVYILHDGLRDSDISALNKCVKAYKWKDNKRIIPVYVDAKLFDKADTTGFSVGTYFRLLMFDLLPDYIDRLLYLDVDLIVNKSIDELYNSSFNGNYIVACSHGLDKAEVLKKVKEGNIFPVKGECFNAGVMLYDFRRMKNNYSFSFFKPYLEKEDIYYDQGILNYLFWDKTEYLPTEIYNNRGHNKVAEIENSVIIHYADANPWEMIFTKEDLLLLNKYKILHGKKNDCLNEYYINMVSIWWEYAKYSEFYSDFFHEAEIMHRYFMDRILRTYFQNMEKEHRLLKFKEKLLEKTIDGSLIRDLKDDKGIEKCSIYGMGYFGSLVSTYLRQYIEIPYYVDRFIRNNTDIEYRTIDQINDTEIPVLVCIWNADEKMIYEIKSHTNAEVILLSQLLGEDNNV